MNVINIVQLLLNMLWLMVEILYYICQSTYYFFVSQKKSVTGEIVLITGTGHGIGKELAIQYACLGAKVVCLDINKQTNEQTVKEIKHIGKDAYAYQCNVSRREEVLAVAKKIKEEVGEVTILVNNAGIMPCHNFLDYTTDEIMQTININVLAHFWMLQAYLPSMIKRNYGHIVALSSMAGIIGFPYLVPYSASKYAVEGLMEALDDELRLNSKGKSLIKFTTISPYMVDTGLCKNPRIDKKLEALFPLVLPKDTAAQIIEAQQKDIKKRTVPSFWLPFILVTRTLPDNAQTRVKDFLNLGVNPD